MAYEKQGWKETLQTAKSEGRGYDDTNDDRAKKKVSSLHYKRRKLDKDVKRYIKDNRSYRSSEFERIGRQHGFYIEATPLREDRIPQQDA